MWKLLFQNILFDILKHSYGLIIAISLQMIDICIRAVQWIGPNLKRNSETKVPLKLTKW